MRSMKMSRASLWEDGASSLAISAKSVVPVRAFQPDFLLRISSAVEMCRSFVLEGESLLASDVKWNIRLGSMSPERVAPGRPLTGVRPIVVSMLRPDLMAQAEAPLPRCRAIMLREVVGLERCFATARVI